MTRFTVWLLPYLSLPKVPTDIGPWRLQAVRDTSVGEYADPQLFERVNQLCGRYRNRLDEPFQHVLVCKRGDEPIGATTHDAHGHRCLQLALNFGMIAEQLAELPGPLNWPAFQSTDNSDLHIWPIDLVSDGFTMQFGGYLRTLSGGFKWSNPKDVVRAPLELPLPPFGCRFDDELASYVFGALDDGPDNEPIRFGIQQLSRAWRNSMSVTFEDQVPILKSAFEAVLLPGDRANAQNEANELKRRFSTIERGDLLAVAPTESLTRAQLLERLSGWYLECFTKIRNAIVHDGKMGNEALAASKEDPKPPFAGDLVAVASRILADLIRVELHNRSCRLLTLNKTNRARWRSLDKALAKHGSET